MATRTGPTYALSFTPTAPNIAPAVMETAPRVAIVREEGSNGDREMVAALAMAGFQVRCVACCLSLSLLFSVSRLLMPAISKHVPYSWW